MHVNTGPIIIPSMYSTTKYHKVIVLSSYLLAFRHPTNSYLTTCISNNTQFSIHPSAHRYSLIPIETYNDAPNLELQIHHMPSQCLPCAFPSCASQSHIPEACVCVCVVRTRQTSSPDFLSLFLLWPMVKDGKETKTKRDANERQKTNGTKTSKRKRRARCKTSKESHRGRDGCVCAWRWSMSLHPKALDVECASQKRPERLASLQVF